jgi:hypothetical protein
MWSATLLLMWHSQSPRMVADGALPQFVTVPMDQFPLKWRFTDPRYDVLPAIHLTSRRNMQGHITGYATLDHSSRSVTTTGGRTGTGILGKSEEGIIGIRGAESTVTVDHFTVGGGGILTGTTEDCSFNFG